MNESMCDIGGIVLNADSRSTGGKTCHSAATLSTTDLTRTVLGSNPGLRDERPATDHLSRGTASADGSHSDTRRLNMCTVDKVRWFYFFKPVVGIVTVVE
jgi:hypothetical protein